MRKGILLIAVGSSPELRSGYRNWAKNMIRTIRKFSPEIPIQLLYDGDQPELDCDYFTNVTGLCEKPHTFEPAEIKLRLDDFTEFDATLYLDVDGCIIKPLEPLFEECKGNFCTQQTGFLKRHEGQKFMRWAKSEVIWEKYDLEEDESIPATNTSFIYFEKTDVFKESYKIYKENPLSLEEQDLKWGQSGSQPDEFYINLTLRNHEFKSVRPLFFKTIIDTSKYISLQTVTDLYYGIGCFGGVRYNHADIQNFYNQIMKECGEFTLKYHNLISKKFYELQKIKKNEL